MFEDQEAFHRRLMDDERHRFRPVVVERLAFGTIRNPRLQRLTVVTPRIASWRTVMMVDYKVKPNPDDRRITFVTGSYDIHRAHGRIHDPWVFFDPGRVLPTRVLEEMNAYTTNERLNMLEAAAFMTYWDGMSHGWVDAKSGRMIP